MTTSIKVLQFVSWGKFTPFECSEKMQKKNPRAACQTLKFSVSMLNVEIHDSAIRKGLNKCSFFSLKCFSEHCRVLEVSFRIKRTFADAQINHTMYTNAIPIPNLVLLFIRVAGMFLIDSIQCENQLADT